MSTVSYKSAAAVDSTRPSPIIWADCPVIAFLKDPGKGFHVFDDFLECPGATTVAGSRWYAYIIGSGSLVLADGEKGELQFDHADSDNEEVTITTGNNTTGCITPANNSEKKWWFEVRVKVESITTDHTAMFVGLAQEGQAVINSPIEDDATHDVNDIDHVGFHIASDDGDGINFVWSLNGQTAQVTADVQTAVSDTYYRLGFKYDPNDNKVHCYVDGVENIGAAFLMSHASAPDDCLAVVLALKADATVSAGDIMTVDWVRYASEY